MHSPAAQRRLHFTKTSDGSKRRVTTDEHSESKPGSDILVVLWCVVCVSVNSSLPGLTLPSGAAAGGLKNPRMV